MSGHGGDFGKLTNAEWRDLITVIERQTAELQRVSDLLEQLVDQGLQPAPPMSGPVAGDPEELLDVKQAAQLLGVTPTFIYSRPWGGPDGLPRTYVGRLVRWRRADLEAWVARGRRGGPDDPLTGYLDMDRERRTKATRRFIRQMTVEVEEFRQRPQLRRHVQHAHDPGDIPEWASLTEAKDYHLQLHRQRKHQARPHTHRWPSPKPSVPPQTLRPPEAPEPEQLVPPQPPAPPADQQRALLDRILNGG